MLPVLPAPGISAILHPLAKLKSGDAAHSSEPAWR